MSKTPFMPLWVSDFLGDTLDLDATEIGAYMLLLMAQWNRDGDSLPNDDEKLKRVARCGRNWAKIWGNIERYFDEDENGIFSKRLRLEAQNVAAKREVNARNGAIGGKRKALKTNKPDLANATDPLQRNLSIPEPEPYKRDTDVSLVKPRPIPEQAISIFNEVASTAGWSQVQKLTAPRRAAVLARVKDVGGLDGWSDAIDRASRSPLLTGDNQRGWRADFDWLCKPANFTKLMEGNYDPRPASPLRSGPSNHQGSSNVHQGQADGFARAIHRKQGGG